MVNETQSSHLSAHSKSPLLLAQQFQKHILCVSHSGYLRHCYHSDLADLSNTRKAAVSSSECHLEKSAANHCLQGKIFPA